jgi:hypothetical protein
VLRRAPNCIAHARGHTASPRGRLHGPCGYALDLIYAQPSLIASRRIIFFSAVEFATAGFFYSASSGELGGQLQLQIESVAPPQKSATIDDKVTSTLAVCSSAPRSTRAITGSDMPRCFLRESELHNPFERRVAGSPIGQDRPQAPSLNYSSGASSTWDRFIISFSHQMEHRAHLPETSRDLETRLRRGLIWKAAAHAFQQSSRTSTQYQPAYYQIGKACIDQIPAKDPKERLNIHQIKAAHPCIVMKS